MDSVSPQCIESFWQAGVAKGAFKSRLESEAGIEAAGWRCPPLSGLRCKIARLFFLSSIEVFSAKKAESRALWMLVYDFRVWHVAGRTVKHEAGDTSFGSRPRSTCAQTNMFLLFYLFIFEKKTFNRYFLRVGGNRSQTFFKIWQIESPSPSLSTSSSSLVSVCTREPHTRAHVHTYILLRWLYYDSASYCISFTVTSLFLNVIMISHVCDVYCYWRFLPSPTPWHSCACGGPYFCVQLLVLQCFVLPYTGWQ